MAAPFAEELVRRIELGFSDVTADIRPSGAATVRFRAAGVDHPLALYVHERDLASAVAHIGSEVRDDLWPGSTIEDAGFNLLLVHLDEVLATRDTSEPLRITRTGLTWPKALRVD